MHKNALRFTFRKETRKLGEDQGLSIILALKIVKLRKVKQDRRFVALAIPYTIYFGTKNENRDLIQQNHVFDSLGEDLGEAKILG